MVKLTDILAQILQEEKEKRDRCLRIADRKFKKPSAYKSGAVVRCRQGEIWKDIKEGEEQLNIQDVAYQQISGLLERGIKSELWLVRDFLDIEDEDIKKFKYEIKRVPLSSIKPSQFGEDYKNASSESEAEEFQKILSGEKDIEDHRLADFYPIAVNKRDNKIIDGNHRHYALSAINSPYVVVLYIDIPKEYLKETDNPQSGKSSPYGSGYAKIKETIQKILQEDESLRKWFKRQGAPGKTGGWVDCNAPIRKDGKITGYKPCGRKKGEKRAKYPSCRPTAAKCKDPGKGKKWGKTK
jgi:hypothetical protein